VPGNPGDNNDGLVGATLADLALVTSANSTYFQNSGVLIMNACRVTAAVSQRSGAEAGLTTLLWCRSPRRSNRASITSEC
jgi:hypothetical protein